MTVAVVGAGIAGLCAAHDLMKAGAEVVVLESERRAGGVIVTDRPEGKWVVEGGPDSFLAADQDIPRLAGELGIADRIVRQTGHGFALWTGTTFQPLDEGQAAALLGIQARKEDLAAGHASLAGGMAELVEALVETVRPALRFRVGVTGGQRVGGAFRLAGTGGQSVHAEAVVIALPAYAAARLFTGVDLAIRHALTDVRYDASLTVSLAYTAEQVGARLDGTGFVVSAAAGIPLRACTYASAKFPGRAPAGHVLLRAFLGAAEGEPAEVAHAALAPVLGISGQPLWTKTYAWRQGLRRPAPHYAAEVARVRERLANIGPIVLAGAGFDGPGVSGCVRSGREAAAEIAKRLGA